MTRSVVVIAVGNPLRRDDGIGPVVAESLRSRVRDDVDVVEELCEPGRLIEAWDGAQLCVLVDALATDAEPGTVQRVDLKEDVPFELARTPSSTHALAIADAVAMGRTLGRLPQRLVLVGIEAADTGEGPGLSARVERAVPTVVRAVLDEIGMYVRCR